MVVVVVIGVDEEFVDVLVFDFLVEGEDVQFGYDVKFVGVVEMQDIREEFGVAVKVEFTLDVVVVIVEFQNGFM